MKYGKIFQEDFHKSSSEVKDLSVDRIYDTTSGFKGHSTIADFQMYKFPYQYYFELKSYQGERLPMSGIRDNQFNGLMSKSKIDGVIAGIIINFRISDKDQQAYFIDIRLIDEMILNGKKSISVNDAIMLGTYLDGTIKRTRFTYDVEKFIKRLEGMKGNEREEDRDGD